MSSEEIFAWLAAFFCTIILVPQIFKTLKTKRTDDLSMMMLLFSAIGNTFWALHASLTGNVPLLVGATLIMLMSLFLMFYKYQNEKK